MFFLATNKGYEHGKILNPKFYWGKSSKTNVQHKHSSDITLHKKNSEHMVIHTIHKLFYFLLLESFEHSQNERNSKTYLDNFMVNDFQ